MTDTSLMRSVIPHQAPCPGQCNRAHRARPDEYDPVMGEPVWCDRCARSIAAAIEQLPDLAVWLWAIGHDEAATVMRRVVDRDVETRGPDPVVIHVRDTLDCGHRAPTATVSDPASAPDVERPRACWRCAIDDPGIDGRLAPAPASARKGPRRLGSPAGSASYLAVDEVVTWAVRTADYLKARLPGEHSATPSVRTASEEARAAALSECSTFLAEWIYYLLATPHARAIGREALDLQRRASRAAGVGPAPDQFLPGVPCPACDRIALQRLGANPDRVTCTRCGAWHRDRDLRMEDQTG